VRINFEVVEPDLRTVAILLEALTALDQVWIHDHPRTPHLYESGVRFVEEDGAELWPTIPIILARGYGNCDQLSAWLAAFYRSEGWRDAVAFPVHAGPGLVHCLVSRDGSERTIEDPSAVLGSPPIPPEMLARIVKEAKPWLVRSCRSWVLPRSL